MAKLPGSRGGTSALAWITLLGVLRAAPLALPESDGYVVSDGLVSVVRAPHEMDADGFGPVAPLPQGESGSPTQSLAPEGILVPSDGSDAEAAAPSLLGGYPVLGWPRADTSQAFSTDEGWFGCRKKACWTARVEAIALWRSAPANRPLITTQDTATQTIGPVVMNANQMYSDVLAAPRLTVARLDECGSGIETSYLYAGNFYAQRSLPTVLEGYALAAPGIYGNVWGSNTETNPAPPISSAQQTLVATFQSAEVNLREQIGWGSTRFLIGFRWFQWWENWSMVDQYQNPDPEMPTPGVDFYSTKCINNLYGGQIGLDTVLWNPGQGRMRVEGLVKAGVYYNASTQASSYAIVDSVADPFYRQVAIGSPGSPAFAGEVGLTAVVPLRRNLDLRCGYFGLWLEGLASPTNQLSGQRLIQNEPAVGSIVNNGSVVLQGLSLGLEQRW